MVVIILETDNLKDGTPPTPSPQERQKCVAAGGAPGSQK